jgi:cytoskeletal protein RodZ
MNNDLCISQTFSNDNVTTSRIHDRHIVMNKGEINTGESNENENVHKSNESVVSKSCCFNASSFFLNVCFFNWVLLFLFWWFALQYRSE